MEPLKRPRLVTIIAAISLVFFALTAALWIRSNFANDYLMSFSTDPASQKTRGLMIYADDGRIALISRLHDHPTRPMPDRPWHLESRRKLGSYNEVRFYRFSSQPGVPGGRATRTELVLRLWPLVVLTSVLPALWLVGGYRRGPAPGVCSACGYQLQGNVSGVCPECGRTIPTTKLK